MSFLVQGAALTKWGRLTDGDATTIFTASSRTTIVGMRFKHSDTSGTPTLTVLRNDSTNDFYFRNAEAITAAKETVVFDEVFVLNVDDTLVAQSGDSGGDFHYRITYLAPNASAK